MTEALSALKLKKNLVEGAKALGGIPQAAFTASSAYQELRLNLYPMLLALADKLVALERDQNDLGASVVEHDEMLADFARDFTPTAPVLKGLMAHLVSVDELISNVHAMSKAQMEAIADPGAKAELGKALKELMTLAEANAVAIADVKRLIAEAEEPDEEGDEGEDEGGESDDKDDGEDDGEGESEGESE